MYLKNTRIQAFYVLCDINIVSVQQRTYKGVKMLADTFGTKLDTYCIDIFVKHFILH